MKTDQTLQELRELNSGANPEEISKEDILELDEGSLTDVEGHVYHKTRCRSEAEYILNHRGEYGVVYMGEYYRQI